MAELPKVCDCVSLPLQAGDDEVLANMKRGYTRDDYIPLVERVRGRIPNTAITHRHDRGLPR